jgi:hypothetical protein
MSTMVFSELDKGQLNGAASLVTNPQEILNHHWSDLEIIVPVNSGSSHVGRGPRWSTEVSLVERKKY